MSWEAVSSSLIEDALELQSSGGSCYIHTYIHTLQTVHPSTPATWPYAVICLVTLWCVFQPMRWIRTTHLHTTNIHYKSYTLILPRPIANRSDTHCLCRRVHVITRNSAVWIHTLYGWNILRARITMHCSRIEHVLGLFIRKTHIVRIVP